MRFKVEFHITLTGYAYQANALLRVGYIIQAIKQLLELLGVVIDSEKISQQE